MVTLKPTTSICKECNQEFFYLRTFSFRLFCPDCIKKHELKTRRVCMNRFYKTPAGRESKRKYLSTPKAKEMVRKAKYKYWLKYKLTPNCKEAQKKGMKKYLASPKGKAVLKRINEKKRMITKLKKEAKAKELLASTSII